MDDDQSIDKGAELSAGPGSEERIAHASESPEERDAARDEAQPDQAMPDDVADAMHGRG
jgi:hypothetical protein